MGVGGKGTGKSVRTRLSKLPFSKLPCRSSTMVRFPPPSLPNMLHTPHTMPLVAQSSATPASVAATHPCSASFLTIQGRQVRQGLSRGCSAIPLLHPLEKPQDSEEIWCDTCSATRVARQGVPAHVCNYVLHTPPHHGRSFKHVATRKIFRHCLKYVQSNFVPPRLLPNSCLLNPGRGPRSNRPSRFLKKFLVLSKGKATKFTRPQGLSKLTRFRNTENFKHQRFPE